VSIDDTRNRSPMMFASPTFSDDARDQIELANKTTSARRHRAVDLNVQSETVSAQ
jgi:hypothetical protein